MDVSVLEYVFIKLEVSDERCLTPLSVISPLNYSAKHAFIKFEYIIYENSITGLLPWGLPTE